MRTPTRTVFVLAYFFLILVYPYFAVLVMFWSGNDNATGGVGVLLAEEWWEKVFEVVRVSDRIILIRMTIGKTMFVFVCVYAPQANLSKFE